MITRELFIKYANGVLSTAEIAILPQDTYRGLAFLKSAAKLCDALASHGFRSTALNLSERIGSGDAGRIEETLKHSAEIFQNLDRVIGSTQKPYYDDALSLSSSALRMFYYLIDV